ncbi:MAG TPA: TauD/TfdA family dioxygenase [Acidimicrobiales bacterium]|jgi:taurine dioxygenase|nr:TauD/TfdA family dioxygenase [Acidimicrobiales bacterium]
MKIMPLDGRIGAEVDLDLSGPWTEAPEDVEELREAFRTFHLLLFRDPVLAAEDQIRLVEALELVPDEWTNGDRFGFLSNKLAVAPNDGQHNAYLFHSDLMWKDQPINSISLFAMVLPDEPAPTVFASGVGAAADLPDDLRARVHGQQGLFLIDFTGGDKRYSEETASPEAPRATQSVLYDDPVSRQTSLVVDSLFFDKLVGWDRDESEALRSELHTYLYAPTNLYTHQWQVGDLVIWNNVALQHARPQLPSTGERTHRRVSGTYRTGTSAWDASFRS